MSSIKFDTKGIDNLLGTLDNLSDVEIAAGVFQESGMHEEAELHKAHLLVIQEKGAIGIFPARPVIGLTTHEEGVKWGEDAVKDIKGAIDKNGNRSPLSVNKLKKSLENVADEMADDIKANFGSSKLAANSPSTIARKGGNNPLIESGELRDSIEGKVRRSK